MTQHPVSASQGIARSYDIVRSYEIHQYFLPQVASIAGRLASILKNISLQDKGSVSFYGGMLNITTPSHSLGLELANEYLPLLMANISFFGGKGLCLNTPTCSFEMKCKDFETEMSTTQELNRNSSYLDVLHKMVEWREAGSLVCVTGQVSHNCYHMATDLITFDRNLMTPEQWHGHNFDKNWRNTLAQREEIIQYLERDTVIRNVSYQLTMDDGTMRSYFDMDYFLVDNYLGNGGEPVRISVCRPDSWEPFAQEEQIITRLS